MERDDLNDRLSRIDTQWSLVFQAHRSAADLAAQAHAQLVQRYRGAVYRYLLGAVRDADVAGDLAQEFMLRLLRGDFRRAAPERGRLRNYLKTVLIHLVDDHFRARQQGPQRLGSGAFEPAAPMVESVDSQQQFVQSWREDLLDRTWKALAAANMAYHETLRAKIERQDASSAELAVVLSTALSKEVNAAWVRKTLQRAHTRFAELLVEEVSASLEGPTPEELTAELRELDLLKYCRSALE